MTQSGVTQRLLDIEQYKRRIDRNQPIVNIYRNAIDLNRFSNAIARRIIVAYNDLIISAVNDLRAIDIGEATAGGGIISPDSVQAQRLRIILAQTKESLNTWTGRSINFLGTQLQGLAELETDFVAQQLRLALEGGLTEGGREVMASEIARRSVNTVAVTPDFAQAVVRFDPADYAAVLPGTGPFTLNLADGAVMTLPNGQVLRKAFAKLAEDSQQKLGVAIRNGLLAGEPTPQIARRLIGSLQQGDTTSTIKQLAAKGGELTSLADNQVLALVRTSVNDVANAASQQVYKANPKITQKYQYVATLDSRTSAICRTLDGQEFEYGKGPLPPQHYNCLPGDAYVSTSGGIAAVYRRFYQGKLYVITTANGHMLRVTPNHPVLTNAGWKPAQSINVGEQVFCSLIIPPKSVANNEKSDAVITAEDVFRSFGESPSVFAVEVPTAAPDFHGDVSSSQDAEQITVVLANRELLFTVNPGLLKTLLNFSFKRTDSAAPRGGYSSQSFVAVGQTALSSISSGGQGFALSNSSSLHSSKLLFASIPECSPGFQNDSLYGTWRDAETIRDATNANSLVVEGYDQTQVIGVTWEPFSGHVYNFETETGTYCADAILTHNCRSTTIPVVDWEGMGLTPPDQIIGAPKRASKDGQVAGDLNYANWLKNKPDVQREVFGSKQPYYQRLLKKYGPEGALSRMVREDGSEVSLKELQDRYGNPAA
jgi:SPP1 gp7 family putative phage head morphogenesis protein